MLWLKPTLWVLVLAACTVPYLNVLWIFTMASSTDKSFSGFSYISQFWMTWSRTGCTLKSLSCGEFLWGTWFALLSRCKYLGSLSKRLLDITFYTAGAPSSVSSLCRQLFDTKEYVKTDKGFHFIEYCLEPFLVWLYSNTHLCLAVCFGDNKLYKVFWNIK